MKRETKTYQYLGIVNNYTLPNPGLTVVIKRGNLSIFSMLILVNCLILLQASELPCTPSVNTTNKQAKNFPFIEDMISVSYSLKSSYPNINNSRAKPSLEKSKTKDDDISYRHFTYPNRKCHISTALISNLSKEENPVLIGLMYSFLKKKEGNTENSNLLDLAITIEEISYPPICKTCYDILFILYPHLKENKNIKWSQEGCKGAPATVSRPMAVPFPNTTDQKSNHFPKSSNNPLLASSELITIEDNRKRIDFVLECYKGNGDIAATYLPDIRRIKLQSVKHASELLSTCCMKEGMGTIIQFLLKEQSADINYPLKKGLVTPLLSSLINKHQDSWKYFTYMIKVQDIDFKYYSQDTTEDGDIIGIFDFMIQFFRENYIHKKDIIQTADFLLKKNGKISSRLHQLCANQLLLTFCTAPNLLDYIQQLVEQEGACINYKGAGSMTAPMRTLRFNHKDSLTYFTYMVNYDHVSCSEKFHENGHIVTIFDLLFNCANSKNRKDIVDNAGQLIRESKACQNIALLDSVSIQASHANDALLACSSFPGFSEFIKTLLKDLGAKINSTDGMMSAPMIALEANHIDSWEYLMYMHQHEDINPYITFRNQKEKKTGNFFTLLFEFTLQNNLEKEATAFIKSLCEKRKKKDSVKKFKCLLSHSLMAASAYPGLREIVKFCIHNGADLNFKIKGVPFTIPMVVLESSYMILENSQKNKSNIYHQDAFNYLTSILSRPNIQYDLIVKNDQGYFYNLLYLLVLNTAGANSKQFMQLIEVLHKSNPLQKKDLGYLKKRKLFTSDNKFVLKRLQEMVGKVKKKHLPNNNKKKRKRKKCK